VTPPAISVLRAVRVPPCGGDTMWASTVAGYASLPEELRGLADRLWARHTNLIDHAEKYGEDSEERRAYQARFASAPFVTDHPVVRVHPETGERSILLGGHAQNIRGVGRSESAHLFSLLQEAVTRPENTVRWRWRAGDVAIWDNRSTQHYAVNDYGDFPRMMHRVTVAGDVPAGVDGSRSTAIEGNAADYADDE
jgi:taurine dioxygenase